MRAKLRTASRALGPAACCLAHCALIFGAAGGPGFGVGSIEAVFATRLERSAGAPFYDMLAWLAVRLPAGEPGFRLAVLDAVLGARVLGGIDGVAIVLFGDDLAWVAGIQQPDAEAPPERKLHALGRKLWRKQIANEDPGIRALGPAAVHATEELTRQLVHQPGPERGKP